METIIKPEKIIQICNELLKILDKMSDQSNAMLGAARKLEANLSEEASKRAVSMMNDILAALNDQKKTIKERSDKLLTASQGLAKLQEDIARRLK